ncbi:hypothetical protein AB0C28_30680 [Nonomuraea sp. NPDC048892]|uniref:hypothetical protein n=1 Tax=Nonomuraea sp. NPDC048892 TaxID=3154624 RepID=UPI0033F6C956
MSTDRPIHSTGHGDLVQAADGSWWMVLLGTRPRGATPAFHVLGRTLDRSGATFVGRRQQHLSARFSARLDPGAARVGLSLRIDEAHHYDLEVDDGQVSVIARIGPLRQRVTAHAVPTGPLTLTIDVRAGCELPPLLTGANQLTGEPLGVPAAGPDTVAFLFDYTTGDDRDAA